uniref:DUF1738 domain-containing protein n=1 Tax=Strongyloides papillosus TaxID=174720 RepID=A0A0N5C483_STREA
MTKLLSNAGHDEPGKIYYIQPYPAFVDFAKNPSTVKAYWNSKEDMSSQKEIFQILAKSIRYQSISILNDNELENFIMGQKFDIAISKTFCISFSVYLSIGE